MRRGAAASRARQGRGNCAIRGWVTWIAAAAALLFEAGQEAERLLKVFELELIGYGVPIPSSALPPSCIGESRSLWLTLGNNSCTKNIAISFRALSDEWDPDKEYSRHLRMA